jgi:NADH-quinone oxidoreductase subunit A
MSTFTLRDYFPILLVFMTAIGFAGVNILLSTLLGQRKATNTKMMPYECGKDPVGSARERYSVKFYLIAMIFILFDIEAIFLIPWAVVFNKFKAAGMAEGAAFPWHWLIFTEMMLFVVLLLVGYAYIWRKGAFDWSDRARVEAEAEARALKDLQARQTATPLKRAA